MTKLLTLLTIALLAATPLKAAAESEETVTVIVKTSPQSSFCSALTVRDNAGTGHKILHSQPAWDRTAPEWPRAYIRIGKQAFTYDALSRLYDPSGQRRNIPADVAQRLEQWVGYVEKAHFGQPLPWKQVRKTFRRMSYATVTDLETGKQFHVQRRAGSRHADVQPLTKRDTATMREIYDGKWSWRRRAILLTIDGRHYAASMHGMPHGAGAIVGNNFPGHFCIHFVGSATHRRREPDPSHKMMILKASGQLRDAVLQASPAQLADYILLALREHDHATLQMLTKGAKLAVPLEAVDSVRRVSPLPTQEVDDMLMTELPVTVATWQADMRPKKEVWIFTFHRGSPLSAWKLGELRRSNETA